MRSTPPRSGRRVAAVGVALVAVAAGLWWVARPSPGTSAPAPAPEVSREVTPPVPAGPGDLFVDATRDAGLDAFVHHLCDGHLSNVIEALGAGGCLLDADGDGLLDVYLVDGAALPGVSDADPARHRHRNRLFRNRGDGTFEDVTDRAGVGDAGFGVAAAAADYDNDGDTDLYVVNVGRNVLYRNRGDGTFEDVTEQAGVGDEGTGVGAVFCDVDGDGLLDLFVVNYLTYDPDYTYHYQPDAFPGPLAYEPQDNVLYHNRGDGTFEDWSERSGIRVSGNRGMAAAAFDADGDGDVDLYVTNDATPNLLLLNDGSGRFREAGLEAMVAYGQSGDTTASMAADVGDCNGDGLLDILVTDTSYGSLFVARSDGVFQDRVAASGIAALAGQYVSWGGNFIDFDNDGDLDVFVANGDLHHLVGWEDLLLENLGDGRFRDAADRGGAWFRARLRGRASAVGDLNDDGRPDLVITHLADRPALLLNRDPSGNHWITLRLHGRHCNRDGFGTRIEVEAGGRRLVAEARCPSGYLFQGDPRPHFGLGRAARVDRIRLRWPCGREQVLRDVPVDRILDVTEPEGSR